MNSNEDFSEKLKYFALAFALFAGGNWMLDSALLNSVKSTLASHRQKEVHEMLTLGHVEMNYLKALRTLQAAHDIRNMEGARTFSPFAVPEMDPWEMLNELKKPALREKVQDIVSTHGFFNVEDWVRHWYSLLMSAAYYDSQMHALKHQVSDEGKRQVVIPRPPAKNLRSVALLLQNKELGKWLQGMMEKLSRLH